MAFLILFVESHIWRRLDPAPSGHYIYLRRFVPSPFFALSETCCFRMLSSSAFLSLPGQAQIRASKHRRPRTCPLGIREEQQVKVTCVFFLTLAIIRGPSRPSAWLLRASAQKHLAEHRTLYMPPAKQIKNIPFALQRPSEPLAEQLYLATYFEGNLS